MIVFSHNLRVEWLVFDSPEFQLIDKVLFLLAVGFEVWVDLPILKKNQELFELYCVSALDHEAMVFSLCIVSTWKHSF